MTTKTKTLQFTILESLVPPVLTKTIGLNADGSVRKVSGGNMQEGLFLRASAAGLHELNDRLQALKPAQCVTWGLTEALTGTICTQKDAQAGRIREDAITRTRENFLFHGAGVLMIDHDGLDGLGGAQADLSAEGLRARLITAAPVLANAPMLLRASASSGCIAPDGRVLTGQTKHRIYIPVRDASLIPDAGAALAELLWARPGDGWIVPGKAGQALKRCLVDTSVWQPERIDFAAVPILQDGVTRAVDPPMIHGDPHAQFDLRPLIASVTPQVTKAAAAHRAESMNATRKDRERIAKAWAKERGKELAARAGVQTRQAVQLFERAALHKVLMGDFELIHKTGRTVTVCELLDAPAKWHGEEFADPLEPGEDQRVAIARLLNGTRPNMYSHYHGGTTYELRRQSARVQVGVGMRIETTDAVLRVLQQRGEVFDYGDAGMAFVTSEGEVRPVNKDWLLDHMGRVAEFFRVKQEKDEHGAVLHTREIAEDAPPMVASAVLAKHDSRGLPDLQAVCTAPVLRIDGSILDTPGYDEATRLLYVCREVNPPRVPLNPTVEQALDALAYLWHPVRLFPLADDASRAVVVQAFISAVLRPSLPTCPGVAFNAPAAGSGKTRLARCIGVLGTGNDPPTFPPANDEDECRKRLTAALRCGRTVILWDNIREPFGNAAIDAFLTSETWHERVLGVSDDVTLPNRALFIATGNNLVLSGDTFRRVLMATIDAQMEDPYMRDFDFNPLDIFLKNRTKMAVAALTLVRAHIAAGRPKMALGSLASFELWDDLVRQPVLWLAEMARNSGRNDVPRMCDPLDVIKRANADNPENQRLSALLHAWYGVFGNQPTTVAEVVKACKNYAASMPKHELLHAAVTEIAEQQGLINVRVLGRWVLRNVERICDGMRFVKHAKAHGVQFWKVVPHG